MAPRALAAVGIPKKKAKEARQEIPDEKAAGLRLVIQPSGAKSFAMRFRRPNGAHAKLTLGPFNPGKQIGEPCIGAPLTLKAARALAARLNLEREGGVDLIAAQRVQQQRRRLNISEAEAKSFSQAARDFLKNHKVRKTGERPRRWRETASLLGLYYPLDGSEPTVIRGGLCAQWRDRRADEIDFGRHPHGDTGQGYGTDPQADGRRARHNVQMAEIGSPHQDQPVHRRSQAACSTIPGTRAEARRGARIMDGVRYDRRRSWQEYSGTVGCAHQAAPSDRRTTAETRSPGPEDAELNGSLISLPASRTKNGLPFDLPLSPLAREILDGVQRMPNCKYIFSTNGKTPVSGFSKVKKRLDEIIATNRKDNGVTATMPAWRVHDLRRVASTGMNNLGVFPHHVEAVLDQVSGAAKQGVAGVYNKALYNTEKRAALIEWADYIREIVS